MRITFHKLLFTTCILCAGVLCRAQQQPDLPSLPEDAIYKKGSLPNGVKWYMVTNKSHVGRCDISLLQKADASLTQEQLLEKARARFSAVDMYSGSSFESFLARNGIRPGPDGYFSADQSCISYDFKDCCTSRPSGDTDSLILSVVRIIQASKDQPSSSQAVVICGDIDPSSLSSKLSLLSLTAPSCDGKISEMKYEWNPAKTYSICFYDDAPVPQIRARWLEARIPQKYMSTMLPAVSRKLSGEFGWVLRNRLHHAFKAAGLRVWVDCDYRSSEDGPGDETHSLTLSCVKSWRGQAKMVLEEELDRLLTYGVDAEEYACAREAFRQEWTDKARELKVGNAEYVAKCKSAFLYGASLASESVKMEKVYRPVPEETQLSLFNDYMWKLLDQTSVRDSTLEKSSHVMLRSDVEKIISYYVPRSSIKVSKVADEASTGGQMWTFANGLNVIYKKLDTKGLFYYSLASKGRRDAADEDYLCCINGVDEENLSRYMSSLGMKMKVELGETDVRLLGSAPDENASGMLDVLCAIVGQDENKDAFAASNYKLLTLVTDLDEEEVKKMMARYATRIGGGSSWKSGVKVPSEEPDSLRSPGGAVSVSKKIQLSRTTANKAHSEVARIAAQDCLAEAFAGKGVQTFVRTYTAPFPSEAFYMSLGARRAPLGHFAEGEAYDNAEADLIRATLRSLSSKPLPAARVKQFCQQAKDNHSSQMATPQYYIQVSCDRYLDNKDLHSQYLTALNAVTPKSLQEFFKKFNP